MFHYNQCESLSVDLQEKVVLWRACLFWKIIIWQGSLNKGLIITSLRIISILLFFVLLPISSWFIHCLLTFPHLKGYTEQYIAAVFGKQHWPNTLARLCMKKRALTAFKQLLLFGNLNIRMLQEDLILQNCINENLSEIKQGLCSGSVISNPIPITP